MRFLAIDEGNAATLTEALARVRQSGWKVRREDMLMRIYRQFVRPGDLAVASQPTGAYR